jgi:hypothetical protein
MNASTAVNAALTGISLPETMMTISSGLKRFISDATSHPFITGMS